MKLRHTLILLVSILFYSCANRASPKGGPKDLKPPVLQSSIPENQSLNFNGRTVEFIFDEYVNLNNPRQQIIISPRVEQDVLYSFRRNKVIVEFTEPLQENTTYNINFREAIEDITEKNKFPLNFAFSTGDYIDSLKISGTVINELTDQPVPNLTVALQYPMDTSFYFLHPPVYFTKTGKDGKFTLYNLKDGQYRIYAFADLNNDLKLQSSKEMYGFLHENINLQSEIDSLIIPAVLNNTDTLNLISSRQGGRYYYINYNKYLIDYDIINNSEELPYMLSEDHKNIQIFNIQAIQDSVLLTIKATDSIGYVSNETIYVKSRESKSSPSNFEHTFDKPYFVKSNPAVLAKITFNKPVQKVNYDSIYFYVDSLNLYTLNPENIEFDSSRTIATISFTPDPILYQDEQKTSTITKSKSGNYVHYGKGAFISVENDSSISNQQNIKIYTTSQLGILFVEIDVPFEYYIVELLDPKGTVYHRRSNENEIKFIDLLPGTYNLRVLEDKNNDGRWQPGNIYSNDLPDDVIYFYNSDGTKEVVIRANWEVGPYSITK